MAYVERYGNAYRARWTTRNGTQDSEGGFASKDDATTFLGEETETAEEGDNSAR